ncbi:MAG: nuclear transport factor 2 family protein [Acidimicrobiia bacterium]
MAVLSNQQLAQKNRILKGYAAFNDGDDATLAELLSDHVVWHLMDSDDTIEGKEAVVAYLLQLRGGGTEAELFGVYSHEQAAVTLDFTSGGVEGPHACADKIEFDDAGLICEVWHCATGTHRHGDGGHPDHDQDSA